MYSITYQHLNRAMLCLKSLHLSQSKLRTASLLIQSRGTCYMQAAAPQQAASQPQGIRIDAGQIAAKLVAMLTEIIGVTVSPEEPLMEVLSYTMPWRSFDA